MARTPGVTQRSRLHHHNGRRPRQYARADALGVALHWLCSRGEERLLCPIFGLPSSTLNRIKGKAITALDQALGSMHRARIAWPSSQEIKQFCGLVAAREPRLPNVFGFVDGLFLPIRKPTDPKDDPAYYNGMSKMHGIANVLAYSPDGCIMFASYNNPGCWHDAACSEVLFRVLHEKTPRGYSIVADSAFPSSKLMATRILTPLKASSRLPDDADARRDAIARHNVVTSLRQAAEWGMRSVQASFPRIKLPDGLPADKHKRARILFIIFRLFNFRVRVVGVNQIRTVFHPQWHVPASCEPNYDRIAKYYRSLDELCNRCSTTSSGSDSDSMDLSSDSSGYSETDHLY